MFKSSVVVSSLVMCVVFGLGGARACPVERGEASTDAAALCAASDTAQKARGSLASLPRLREGGFDGWEQALAAPDPMRLALLDSDLSSPIAAQQEAEDFLRRESVAEALSSQNAAAALNRLPGPLGAVGALDALKRQDAEKWRQLAGLSVKRGWEFDYAPTKDTMLRMKDFYSPTMQKTLAEAALGVAVFDAASWGATTPAKVYVGPFAVADGLRRDQMTKFGAHLTVSEIGAFHVTFAGGVAHDRPTSRGAFGLVETSWRF